MKIITSQLAGTVYRPFTVSPDSGLLALGANMQVTVEYQSMVVGAHCTDMMLHYDTGQYHKL